MANSSREKKTRRSAREEKWPQVREILFRPQRKRYVSGPKARHCVFCEASQVRKPGKKLVLYKGANALVVLNKFPYNPGHLLVVPLAHRADLQALDNEEYFELSWLIRESVSLLQKVYQCKGVNVGFNLGSAAGAGIPNHLHCHVIPRWWGDNNFFPLVAQAKVLPEDLDQMMERLLPAFDRLSSFDKIK